MRCRIRAVAASLVAARAVGRARCSVVGLVLRAQDILLLGTVCVALMALDGDRLVVDVELAVVVAFESVEAVAA